MQYVPRTVEPSVDDTRYYANNPLYKAGYGMPNCTTYAFGRFWENCETLGIYGVPSLSLGNAWRWYGNTSDGYPRGQVAKLGAIACWSNEDGDGHVAVVEQINEDGSIVCSNSAWNGRNFYMTDHNSSYYKPYYTFQGFIYLPKDYEEPKHETGDIYVINDTDGLWLLDELGRKVRAYSQNTKVEYLGNGYNKYGYNYYKVKVLTDNALGYMASDYLTLYEEKEPTPSEPTENEEEKLKKENEELKVTIENLESQINELIKGVMSYKQKYEIDRTGKYSVKIKAGETLIIKTYEDTKYTLNLKKGDIVKIK